MLTSRCKNSRSVWEWCISWLADEEEQPVGNVTKVDAIPFHNE